MGGVVKGFKKKVDHHHLEHISVWNLWDLMNIFLNPNFDNHFNKLHLRDFLRFLKWNHLPWWVESELLKILSVIHCNRWTKARLFRISWNTFLLQILQMRSNDFSSSNFAISLCYNSTRQLRRPSNRNIFSSWMNSFFCTFTTAITLDKNWQPYKILNVFFNLVTWFMLITLYVQLYIVNQFAVSSSQDWPQPNPICENFMPTP